MYEDELTLLESIKRDADIVLIESFAPTKEALWKDSFEPQFVGHIQYLIWNREFPWTPEYGQVGNRACDPKHIGWYFVSNRGSAPVIEFCRSRNIAKGEHGRIYWAKYFAAPQGLDYDVDKFSA